MQLGVEATQLGPAQLRLLNTLNHLLRKVLTTQDEAEYFDSSAEAMRICASLIKQSAFVEEMDENAVYSDQALEYSIELLQDCMSSSKLIVYDN